MKTKPYYAIFTLCISFLVTFAVQAVEISVKLTDIDKKPVADLVVYLVPLEEQNLENLTPTSLMINQTDKKFNPYISVILKGMPVIFNNEDDITHQVYSTSTSNRFSFRIKSERTKSIEPLKNTGKILMGCNIHDWMSGYLLVLNTPLYTKTDHQGVAKFDVKQTGRYTLSVWHPQLLAENQTISQNINIQSSDIYNISLSNKLADIPNQENPESFDFLDDY
ncbi:MAG: hypothetical protein COA74_09530 [Gammaproteobacteria bacterium]|nr:MAG: hypothetical protein COA74_09530 [Gammaproteobacteria bacterium]